MKVKQPIKSVWNYVSLIKQINAQTREHNKEISRLKKEQESSIPESKEELEKDLERITNNATYFVEKLKETSKKIKEKEFGMYNLKKEWGKQDWKQFRILCTETGTAKIAKINFHINYQGKKYTTQGVISATTTLGGGAFIGLGMALQDPITNTYFNIMGICIEGLTLKTLEENKLENYAKHINRGVKEMNNAFADMYK